MAAVLQDVDEFVEALQMGVSSSFDDNGLTPVPAKVQEAVESSAELRTISARAQGNDLDHAFCQSFSVSVVLFTPKFQDSLEVGRKCIRRRVRHPTQEQKALAICVPSP